MLGQGVKACPMSDLAKAVTVHLSASREDIKQWLRDDRHNKIDATSPTSDIFRKTFAFVSSLKRIGCLGPLHESTRLNEHEHELRDTLSANERKLQQGYVPLEKKCQGRLYLLYSDHNQPYIQLVSSFCQQFRFNMHR